MLAAPHGYWFTSTFVAGPREDGLIAPFVLDEPIRGELFLAYVEQVLAPALRPSNVMVMDNLAAHKIAGLEAAIRAVGASMLHLPANSSDLYLIEKLNSKLKAMLLKPEALTSTNSGTKSDVP